MRSFMVVLLSLSLIALTGATARGEGEEPSEVEKELAKIEAEREAELTAAEAEFNAVMQRAKAEDAGNPAKFEEKRRKETSQYMKRVSELERKYALKRANVLAKGGREGEDFTRKTEKELASLEANLTRKIAQENEDYQKKVAEIQKDVAREGNAAKREERFAEAEGKHWESLVQIERWAAEKRRHILQREDKREDRPKNQPGGSK
jgi:hypothetical protein